jgi:ABC-type multidrug transport system fused ATPase/permease subunit
VSGLLLVGSLAGIAMNTAVVLPSVLLGRAVDTVSAYRTGQASSATVTAAVLWLVAGTFATELPRIGKRYWLGVARARIRADLRADALTGVLAWPAQRLHTTAVGEVMARIIGDVEVVGTGIGEVIVETWDTLLFSASLVVAMLWYDVPLGLMAVAPVPLALGLARSVGRAVARRTLAAREANAALTGFVQEGLTGLRVLKVSGRTQAFAQRMEGYARAQAEAELSAVRLSSLLAPVYTTLTSAGVVAVLWYGGTRVAEGHMSVGDLVAFLSLFARFTGRAFRIPQMANRVQAGAAALTRLQLLLAAPPPREEEPRWSTYRTGRVAGLATHPRELPGPPGAAPVSLVLNGVTFTYPGAETPALTAVSLKTPPGSMIAVTGPVGSGKSALARLAAGLYPPDTGDVLLDATAADQLPPQTRDLIGYLPQGHPAFSGTVTENLLLSDHGPLDDRAAAAVRVAALDQDLATMPDGAATAIGEQGVRVSGGQRQRIALARALAAPAHPPRLLILDDPFSALDVETETKIIDALRGAVGPDAPAERRATVLLCSTRLAAFTHADQILVLDHGRIAEQGTHIELLAEGGLYARIHHAQAHIPTTGVEAHP